MKVHIVGCLIVWFVVSLSSGLTPAKEEWKEEGGEDADGEDSDEHYESLEDLEDEEEGEKKQEKNDDADLDLD